ncbi:hypothetical protein [Cupriavidus pauculus]|uniref:Uncharacterized protein n=1 Tax=Cupriavidus pauculus TaxID=82633 RepID=A0A3G8H371_9BURK|nr:hypothetical protein [Cupriavidus pauculus]AZG14908.1 hypothetical protein EHF44_16605 [Cupriavidus pauculus]
MTQKTNDGEWTAEKVPMEAVEAFNEHWCCNAVYDWPESSIAKCKAGIAAAVNAMADETAYLLAGKNGERLLESVAQFRSAASADKAQDQRDIDAREALQRKHGTLATVEDAAAHIERKAETHANDLGYGVGGTLCFGRQEEMDHYTTLTELAEELRILARPAQEALSSAISWSGFNLHGNEASVREARRLIDRSDRLEQLEKEISARNAAPEALGAAKGVELVGALEEARRELHACQAVIHLAGGFDPAYVKGAQAAIQRADAILAKAKGEQSGSVHERDAARWRMHVRMMLRKHGAIEVRETIDAVDHAIAAKEQA